MVVHHKAYRPRTSGGDNQCVDETNVIANQQRRPLLGNIVQAFFLEPINGMNQHPHDEAHQKFRNEGVDINRDTSVENRFWRVKWKLRMLSVMAFQLIFKSGEGAGEAGIARLVK